MLDRLGGFFKKLSPRRRIAVLVKTIADEINDGFELRGEMEIEGSKIKFAARLVDVRPPDKQPPSLPDEESD